MAGAATAKVGPKFEVVIPKELRRVAKLKVGDFLRAEWRSNGILLKPAAIKQIKFKNELKRHLRDAEEDRKAGLVYGPFESAEELLDSLHKGVKRLRKRSHRRA